ncbi:carcinine hydrolase/isopenicillin-N N-acyltransferase family protein [Hymenobacter puniceus]|uniref:carcinine hydrolase/isopenicillin-N N-acyltransferase family protein n=1 Tax=Hymenobacter sp. BT190 TaxID=2763505 RepID=UPI0016518213|nr:carcinine hydrolase/isopenicillin-N N-acyltransferase family protein [Hymenobacter sp. BT190]MBC6700112.1 hypothetical protein [Hymenobacter sp. BT190]
MKNALICLLLLFSHVSGTACTIVSGTDRQGQTWAMNNEDFFHTYSTYVNVLPATDSGKLGYLTLTYGSPDSGVQGGVNEAGVFFDINALPPQTYKLSRGKKPFPHGSMLVYLLERCKSVPEFLALWDTYYLPDMGDVQIHLADKQGNLAVVAPDTIVRSTRPLTTTNFNVCDAGPGKQGCWRYPLAQQALADGGISQSNLVKIAAATSWREFTTTVYTNLHNLATGDMWFYLAEEYATPWKTNIHTLLQQGRRSMLLTSQFPGNASVRLASVLKKHRRAGPVERFLQGGAYSPAQQESLLRLAFLDAFYVEKDFATAGVVFPLWERVLAVNPKLDVTEVQFTKAEVLASQGNSAEAIRVLRAVGKPSWKTDALLANLLGNEQATAVIELPGHVNARAVAVEIKGNYNFLRFLQKTPTGWRMSLKTDRKELKYCFYVDGQRVVDPARPTVARQETVKGDLATFNLWRL